MIEKEGEVIYLDSRQLGLFNLLKRNSSDSESWLSIEDISRQLKVPVVEAKKTISSLRKKEGIVLHTSTVTDSDENKITRYSLGPEILESTILPEVVQTKKQKNIVYSALYLAEPTFGTKAFDDRHLMKGLVLFLESNGLAPEIQNVFLQGGVIPHVPPYSSTSYIGDLRFLGYVKRKNGEKNRNELRLEERISDEFERSWYEEHVNNKERKKITDLSDAFSAAEEQIKILMSALPEETVLRIQLGEEDKKNIRHLEDTYIREWAKEKADEINAQKRDILEDMQFEQEKYGAKKFLEDCLKRISEDKDLKKKPGERSKDYNERICSEFADNISEFDLGRRVNKTETKEIIRNISQFAYWAESKKGKSKETVEKKILQLRKEMEEVGKKKESYESKLSDLTEFLSWTEELLGSGRKAITVFTKQYPVRADEVELAFKKAKDRYTNHFYKWDIEQHPLIHVSSKKSVTVQTGVVKDVVSGKGAEAEVEISDARIGDKKVMMIHNVRDIFSSNISPKAIRDARLDMNHMNMVLSKLYEKQEEKPDIILLGGHCAGGFRAIPEFKESEHIIKGEFVEGQEIFYMINLPTLQSIPKLEWLASHGFSNWHTKRYLSGPYASAAVIHTEDKEGVNRFVVMDSDTLSEFGKIAEAVEVYREQLKDKKLSQKKRREFLSLIKEEKEKVKVRFKKIEAAGDFHLGAPDNLERYSKEQIISASQIYQYEHGLPDIISWDECLHGTEERAFNSQSRYEAELTPKIKEKIEKILGAKDISGEDKANQIAKLALTNQRAITVHNLAEQKNLFRMILKQYADRVLARGGKLILVSGNHYNKSDRSSDEATELANQFSGQLIDNSQVNVFSGKGNPVGVGSIRLPEDKVLFVMHKFPEEHDPIYGVMKHLRKMNNDAEIVIAGDRHHAGAGYADRHMIVLHPGMEPINKYVPLIGKSAGTRGFNNIYYAPDKKGIYAVEFVLNPTLEKIIKDRKII